MTLSNISAETRILAFLKTRIVDYNSDRTSAEWIYDRKPAIRDMLSDSNNFPVITVMPMGPSNGTAFSVNSEEMLETVSLAINVWTVKNMVLEVFTQTGFSWTSGTDIIPDTLPIDKIKAVSVVRNGLTVDITSECSLVDSDGDGLYDTVRMSSSTGISSIVTCNTARVAEGQQLAEWIAQTIHKTFRQYWVDDLVPWLFDYVRTGFTSIDFDQHIGLYRHELQVQFSGVNIGED